PFPAWLISQPPDGNNRSLLTVYLIAPCNRLTWDFEAAISFDCAASCCDCIATCWWSCSFWAWSASYLLFVTHPASTMVGSSGPTISWRFILAVIAIPPWLRGRSAVEALMGRSLPGAVCAVLPSGATLSSPMAVEPSGRLNRAACRSSVGEQVPKGW